MKFFRTYIEITNVCALACSFCPQKNAKPTFMSLELFEKIARELKGKTKEIAFHVMGDPLLNKDLAKYLDMAELFSHKVILTTSGFYLSSHAPKILLHEAVAQINISLNSFNKNRSKISLEEYFSSIFSLIDYKLKNSEEQFINLRLWNLGSGEDEFNSLVFQKLDKKYDCGICKNMDKKESFQVAKKIRVHFDKIFRWPNPNDNLTEKSKCYGMSSQIGILADGRVVPCCLDYGGKAELGNLNKENLATIMKNSHHLALELKSGNPSIELCKRCSYRLRFKEEK